jgi:hypothetical protein
MQRIIAIVLCSGMLISAGCASMCGSSSCRQTPAGQQAEREMVRELDGAD